MTVDPSAVHLWRGALPHLSAAHIEEATRRRWLTPDERASADSKPEPVQRSRFAARRILRRLIVASHLGQDPAQTTIGSRCDNCGGTGHGRPHIGTAGDEHLSVSTSSSGAHTVVALSRYSVGVDLDAAHRLVDLPADRIARTVTGWRVAEGACPPDATPIQKWTALEALAKTTGRGLRATGHELARAARSHRLHWITGPHDLVTCVATAGGAAVATTDFMT